MSLAALLVLPEQVSPQQELLLPLVRQAPQRVQALVLGLECRPIITVVPPVSTSMRCRSSAAINSRLAGVPERTLARALENLLGMI